MCVYAHACVHVCVCVWACVHVCKVAADLLQWVSFSRCSGKAGRVKALHSDVKTCIFPLNYNRSLSITKERKHHPIEGVTSRSLEIQNLSAELPAFSFFLRWFFHTISLCRVCCVSSPLQSSPESWVWGWRIVGIVDLRVHIQSPVFPSFDLPSAPHCTMNEMVQEDTSWVPDAVGNTSMRRWWVICK